MRFMSFVPVCTALIASTIGVAGVHAATTCSVDSPSHRVALVELYTSEGCNSCPPAESWLSALDRARRANTAVPLALHVDYWDSLGWKDRFAQPAFTQRQRQLSDLGREYVVYTPEVFIGGREMRAWSNDARFASTIQQLNAEAASIEIHVDARPAQPGHTSFAATFRPSSSMVGRAAGDVVAYAVVYENRLDSDVKAGENAGVTLHHDRVVRQWIGPVAVANGHGVITGDYAGGSGQSGVVAFAESRSTGEVLQVAELPPCTR